MTSPVSGVPSSERPLTSASNRGAEHSSFTLGLIPCQFITAHRFGQNCSLHIMESEARLHAGFIRKYAYRLLSGRGAVQVCSGHWSILNRQHISGGISCTRSLGVEASQHAPAWVTRWR
jgi:hypothetical protein